MPASDASPVVPDPVQLLDAWLAVEALQPQTFKTQDVLIEEPPPRTAAERRKTPSRAQFPFDLAKGPMPWATPAGDRAQLKIGEDDGLTWYVPLGFVRMELAAERLVSQVEPEGPERERDTGLAVLALAAFDETGRALPSRLLLSSFGWACGEVLAGRVDQLHRFVDVEAELRNALAQALVEQDADGRRIPTSRRRFIDTMTLTMQTLKLPADLLEGPRVAIRIVGDGEGDPLDILNSFFLRDLHKVRTALKAGKGGPVLAAYLGQSTPTDRQDVLADKAILEGLLAPALTPSARWPAANGARLVTLQQAAVNGAMRELAEGGLLSINGPPGTGKTTLLRDVVAAVLGTRADALAEIDDPSKAFKAVELIAEGGERRYAHRLPPALRGHGMVVASSNNEAVKNISAELPRLGAIDPGSQARYFPGTARETQRQDDGDHGAECWGLAAAVLGKRKNRSDFVESAWWHPQWGLEKYLRVAVGKALPDPEPEIIAAEKPPRAAAEGLERWRRARLDYRTKRATVTALQVRREQMRWALGAGARVQQTAEDAAKTLASARRDQAAADQTRQAAALAVSRADTAIDDARQLHEGCLALRPGLWARLTGGDASWRETLAQAQALLRQALANQQSARSEEEEAARRVLDAEIRATAAETAEREAQAQLTTLRELEAEIAAIFPTAQAGTDFWAQDRATIHTASPWADPAWTAARDAMFDATIALQRAFLDAAAQPMKANLHLIMDHLKGKRIPSGAADYLGDLWDSLFLVVPLVSTTFAALDRMLDGMDEGSLGWLIIDEAGQATPQAAAGALWRAQRALVIGDPLQIPPISKVPQGLARAIFTQQGAHPDLWAAPRASAQTLADAASPLGAMLGENGAPRRIGMPLLVHRRCQEPMFSISNAIAYDGLMVHQPGDPSSAIREALADLSPDSFWLDVESTAAKWSVQEGEAVIALLERLAAKGVRDPDLYLIAPFREVADRLRTLVVKSGALTALDIPAARHKSWGKDRIGTVHTFQGKEAEAVFLVLGASADASRGSRDWAGGTPNILNVAATRAKKALYVVGRHAAWRNIGVFAAAAERLPVVVPTKPDFAPGGEETKS